MNLYILIGNLNQNKNTVGHKRKLLKFDYSMRKVYREGKLICLAGEI